MHGLVKDNTGADVPLRIGEGDTEFLSLSRDTLVSKIEYEQYSEYKHRAERLAADSMPGATPAEQVELHVKIASEANERYDDTSRHVLYRVSVETLKPNCSQPISQPHSPFMIMKVATELDGRSIAEEALMYKHLRCLQGTVIPQCYGYFRRFIDLQDYVVAAWDPDCTFPRTEQSFDIFRMPNSRASLNILLLEDVGARIKPALLNKEERRNVLFVSHLRRVCAHPHWSTGARSDVCMANSATSVSITEICGMTMCFRPRSAAVCHRSTSRSMSIAS